MNQHDTIVWRTRPAHWTIDRSIRKLLFSLREWKKEMSGRPFLLRERRSVARLAVLSLSFQRSRSGGGALCRRPHEFRNRVSFPSVCGVKLITLSGGSTSLTLRVHRMTRKDKRQVNTWMSIDKRSLLSRRGEFARGPGRHPCPQLKQFTAILVWIKHFVVPIQIGRCDFTWASVYTRDATSAFMSIIGQTYTKDSIKYIDEICTKCDFYL